jgi:pentose-5-phosphate-3-epimerase
VAEVRKMKKKILIEIEGNVTSKEMREAIQKGTNLVVSGYKGTDPLAEFKDMRYVINQFKYKL